VGWPTATGVPTGKNVTYTVVSASTGDIASEPLLLAGPTNGTTAQVDARVYAASSDGETAAAKDECIEPVHPRVCVVLPEPRAVSLVVVRTPFNPVGQVVELLDTEHRTVGSREVAGDAFDEVYPVRFEEPVRTGLVCLRDEAGAGSGLSEISVW
jgi:hypothetical protein